MAFQLLKDIDFGGGVDQQTAEVNIPAGYLEMADNFDITSEGGLRTRAGHEVYGGQLPVRVLKCTYSTESTYNVKLQLYGGADTSKLTACPLFITGRTSVAGNPTNIGIFKNTAAWTSVSFDTFITPAKVEQLGNGIKVIQPTGAYLHWCECSYAVSFATDATRFWVIPDVDSQSASTYVSSITINTGAPTALYKMQLIGVNTAVGEVYRGTHAVASSDTPQTITITAGTHGLTGNSILARVFLNDGTDLIRAYPDSFTTQVDGTVVITIRQVSGSPQNYVVCLIKADDAATMIGSSRMIIRNVSSFKVLWGFFELQGTSWVEVIPDNVAFIEATGTVTVTCSTTSTNAFRWLARYDTNTPDEIIISSSVVGAGFTDTSPELFIYGINYRDLGLEVPVTYLDAYRDAIGETPVASITGNFMMVQDPSKTTTVPLQAVITTSGVGQFAIGPVFSKSTAVRRLGHIQANNVTGIGALPIKSYKKGTAADTCDIELNAPAYAITGTPFSLGYDYLTVTGCSQTLFNGDFLITAVAYPDANTIKLTVVNSAVLSTVLDDSGNGLFVIGYAGVYCDVVPTTSATPPFIVGDVVTCSVFDASMNLSCTGTEDVNVYLKGVTKPYTLTDLLTLEATRQTRIIPLVNADKFVAHDVITVDGNEQAAVVTSAFPLNTLVCVSVTGDGTAASLVVSGNQTTWFSIGQLVLVYGMAGHTGEHTITAISYDGTDTTISWASTLQTSVTAAGKVMSPCITVDKEVSITHAADAVCLYRWAVQKPVVNSPLPARVAVDTSLVFSSSVTESLRGIMMKDVLYVGSYTNPTKGYDGFYLRDVGIPAWNPIVSAAVETQAAGITVPINAVTASAYNGGTFTVTAGDEGRFRARTTSVSGTVVPGTLIQCFNGSAYEGTCEVVDNTRSGFLYCVVTRGLPTTGTRTLKECFTVSYYARIRTTDSQDNIHIGPTCSKSLTKVELVEGASAVRLVLMEPPTLGSFDYMRGVYIDIFRQRATQAGGVGSYYKVASLLCGWSSANPYQEFIDYTSDDLLTEIDAATTACRSSLTQASGEGVFIGPPLRAACMTTIDNSLVQANIKGAPRARFAVLKDKVLAVADFNATTVTFAGLVFEWVAGSTAITGSSRSGTTVTLTVAGTYTTGDWVYVSSTPRTSSALTGPHGWFKVVTGGSGSCTISYGSGTATFTTGFLCVATARTSIPVFTGADTAFGDFLGNISATTEAQFILMRRMALAMQAAFATLGKGLQYVCKTGVEYGTGVIEVSGQPTDTITVTGGTFSFSLNDIICAKGTAYTLGVRLFPSRLLVSASNYPEVMFNPEGSPDDIASEAYSVIDVNPNDGDEITAVLPFFGEAAFGSAQQSGVLVVFKHRSVYIIDVAQFKQGRQSIQRLDTYGLGCDGGQSPCTTKDGISYVNRFGVFTLKRNLTIEWTSKLLDRWWKANVSVANTVAAFGHTSAPDQNQRFAVGTHTLVFTPSQTTANQRIGAWTLYSGVDAVCYTNAERQTLIGTSYGEVKRVTRYETKALNYYDDAEPVVSSIILRATDFGVTSRKDVSDVFITYRNDVSAVVSTSMALDMSNVFTDMKEVVLEGSAQSDGLTTKVSKKCETLRYKSSGGGKGQFFQVMLTGSGLVELTGITFRVQDMGVKGTIDA